MMRWFAVVVAGLLALVVTQGAYATATHQDGCTSSSTVVCTMAGGAAAGDAAMFFVTTSASVTVSSFTDDKADSCTVVDQKPGGAVISTTSVYCLNLTAAATVFTATLSGASAIKVIAGDRYSGVVASGALDQHTGQKQTTPGTGANAITSTSVTPTLSGELVYAGSVNSTGVVGAGTIASGTGFTTQQTIVDLLRTESLVQGSAGAQAGTFTAGSASDSFNSLVMTFTTGEQASKIASFAVLNGIDERLTKVVAFAVLNGSQEAAAKLTSFVVLCTPPGVGTCPALPSRSHLLFGIGH